MFCSWKRFSQRVCYIQICMYFANLNVSLLDLITDGVEASLDVFGSLVKSGFLHQGYCSGIVIEDFQNIRNGFWPDLGTRNIREKRGRYNLGGAPAPPPPWRPWTRGGTLLPSRGRPSNKEEGDLSPSLPVAPECRRGKNRDGDLHQKSCYRQH